MSEDANKGEDVVGTSSSSPGVVTTQENQSGCTGAAATGNVEAAGTTPQLDQSTRGPQEGAVCNNPRDTLSGGQINVTATTGVLPIDGSSNAADSTALSELQLVIAQQPAPTKAWHQEILFDLFLRSDKKELDSLAAETNTSLSQCAKICKQRRQKQAKKHPSRDPASPQAKQRARTRSELSLLPHILRQLKKDTSRFAIRIPGAWKRPDVSSMDLKDLQAEVFSRFRNSSLGKNAISRPSFYHLLGKTHRKAEVKVASATEDTSPSRFRPASSQDMSTKKVDESNPSSEYEPFALVYNECSLAAVSKWAERGALDGKQAEEEERSRTVDSTMFHRPAASPFFRLCSACKKWGHYELECQELNPKTVVEHSRELKAQKTLRGFVEGKNAEHIETTKASTGNGGQAGNVSGASDETVDDDEYLAQSTACEICGSGFSSETLLLCDGCDCLFHSQCLDPPLSSIPEGDWFCSKCEGYNSDVSSVVEIEGCDGFVIEQRKVPSCADGQSSAFPRSNAGVVGFPGEGWATAVGLVRRDKVPSFLRKRDRSTKPFRTGKTSCEPPKVRLTVGELCWAKRSNAPKGQAGRDEWWPSTVVNVTDRNLDKKSRGHEMTPYVVKMYAAMGAGRVRASNVLPFFQHYEKFGYNRLVGRDSKTGVDMSMFRRGLEEAIFEMGCSSLLQALMKAREICGVDGIKDKKGKIQGLDDDWLDASESLEDGFVVRARREPTAVGAGLAPQRASEKLPATGFEVSNTEETFDDPPSVQNRKIEGSVVAWKWPSGRASKKRRATSTERQIQYGVVVAVDSSNGKALVRPLPEMESMLISNRTVTETRSLWRPPVRSCAVSASIWIRSDELHHICEPAPKEVQSKFLKDVDSRLEEERERLRARHLAEAKRPKAHPIANMQFPKRLSEASGSKNSSRAKNSKQKLPPNDPQKRKADHRSDEMIRPAKITVAALEERGGMVGISNSIGSTIDTQESNACGRPGFCGDDSTQRSDEANVAEILPKHIDVTKLVAPATTLIVAKDAKDGGTQTVISRKLLSDTGNDNADAFQSTSRPEPETGTAVALPERMGLETGVHQPPTSLKGETSTTQGPLVGNTKLATAAGVEQSKNQCATTPADTMACSSASGCQESETYVHGSKHTGSAIAPTPAIRGSTSRPSQTLGTNKQSLLKPEDRTPSSSKPAAEFRDKSSDLEKNKNHTAAPTASCRKRKGCGFEDVGDTETVPHSEATHSRNAADTRIVATLSSESPPDSEPKGSFKRLKKGISSKMNKRGAADSIGAAAESTKDTTDTELTQQLFGDDVYQAERILDERKVRSGGVQGTEYLIKWKGFPLEESTWEPERNILNRNFVRMYQAEKATNALKETAEAKQKGSTTYRMVQAMELGQTKLATGMPLIRNRLCPFCLSRIRSASSFAAHMRDHKGETNFTLIKEAAIHAREDWFTE